LKLISHLNSEAVSSMLQDSPPPGIVHRYLRL